MEIGLAGVGTATGEDGEGMRVVVMEEEGVVKRSATEEEVARVEVRGVVERSNDAGLLVEVATVRARVSTGANAVEMAEV